MNKVTRTFPICTIAILHKGDLSLVAQEHCLHDDYAISKLMESYPDCIYTVTDVSPIKYSMSAETFILNSTVIE